MIKTLRRAVEILDPKEEPLRDMLLDALIIAGLNFFSTLAGIGAVGITSDPVRSLIAAAVAAGVGFFSTLAIKRGVKK